MKLEQAYTQKITPFLWFNGNAEEAMTFYTSIFPNSSMKSSMRYGEAGPGPKGSLMSGTFQLAGQEFFALNGGPQFSFSPAISFFVHCDTQEEVDTYWEKLSAEGQTHGCGWVQDRFGVSWQIVPTILGKLLGSEDRAKADKAMAAMLKMNKLEIAALEAAANAY